MGTVQNSLNLINNRINLCGNTWRDDSLLQAALCFVAGSVDCEQFRDRQEQVISQVTSFIQNLVGYILHFKSGVTTDRQENASNTIARLLQSERIGVVVVHDLCCKIGRIVNECKSLVITCEQQLCQNIENLYFIFWILENVLLGYTPLWVSKEEICHNLYEQLNKSGTDSFPMVACYTFRILSVLSAFDKKGYGQQYN